MFFITIYKSAEGVKVVMPERIQWVCGYHGTAAENVESILRGEFGASHNDYDWLGHGIYFFQDAPTRAWRFAEDKRRSQRGRHPIRKDAKLAIVGAVIRLEPGSCLDLLDALAWEEFLFKANVDFIEECEREKKRIPIQNERARHLDCAIINHAVKHAIRLGRECKIRTARAAFEEGGEIFHKSNLKDLAHVQIVIFDNIPHGCEKHAARSPIEEVWFQASE